MLNPFELDFGDLTGPHFFSLAQRVAAYDGVISLRIEKELEEAKQKTQPSIQTDSNGKRIKGMSGVDWLKSKTPSKANDPLLADLEKQGLVEIQ